MNKDNTKTPFYKKPSFKYSSLATALIAIFIAAIIGLNVLATFVAERIPVDIDLTSAGNYSISEENQKVVESIGKPVKIIFTTSEDYYANGSFYQSLQASGYVDTTGGKYMKQTVELMKNYAKLNNNISVEFVDATTPAFDTYREKFAEYMSTISYGDIIVYCEKTNKHKFLSTKDLYKSESADDGSSLYGATTYAITGSNVETTVTSALDYTTADKTDVVTIITGYNSADTSTLQKVLADNNFDVKTIENLMKDSIPENTDIIVLAGPTDDLTLDEVKKIDTFLENGGKHGKNMLYFGSTAQLNTPNIDALLLDWGIKFEKGSVYETDENYAISSDDGYNTAMMIKLSDSDAASDIASDYQNSEFVGGAMRPMSVAFSENGKYHTFEMFKTSDSTTIMPNGVAEGWKPSSDAKKQSYSAMILSVYVTGDKDKDGEEIRSNVCAVAGYECVEWSAYYNTLKTNNVLISTLNKMVKRDENAFVFDSKEINTSTITVTESQITTVKIIFWSIPVIIIAIGVFVYIRRNRR